MKNTDSDYIFPVESGNEDDEDKDFNDDEDEDEDDEKDYDLPGYADDDQHTQSKHDSLGPSWPQSYRKSIDLYGSITSPTLHFLGSPSLSSLGGSFFSSSPKRRGPVTTSLGSPLLSSGADDQQPQEHHKPAHSIQFQRTSYTKKSSQHLKSHQTRQSSFGQAVVNGVNLLCGVGLLSTPYAVKEGGWVGLSILFVFCVLSFYTGILLRCCLDSRPGLKTYPDIGEVAFGKAGRLLISIVLYVELYAACVEYIILEGDNLSSLFPNAKLSLAGCQLSSHYLFAITASLLVLPTVWLRDMRILSYISAGGVFVSFLLVICLYWIGLMDNISFCAESTTTLNLSTLPVAVGLYGVCYAGHAVLPNIYTSMDKQSQYPLVLLASFGICTFLYVGVAIMGYMMFGESTESQFTLNLPSNLLASKIAVWATVINPFTKYALTISPVAMSLEELIPLNSTRFHAYSILIRTALVISTLIVALSVPFFGLVTSLIGSLLTMLVSLIFPCICFLRILRGNVTRLQGSLCILIIAVGIVSLSFGTYTSTSEIIQQLI